MLPTDRALLTRIETLAIDPPGAHLTFVDRLARDNGWSRQHAAAVDREYRRFLLLAATTIAPVTPSDAVDQAWHLHLAYSRSYWDDLCGGILGRPLHHGPTAGGTTEDARYASQYAATLARYVEVFGDAPPPAVWPPVETRFTDRYVRVVTKAPDRFTPRRIMLGAGLVGAISGATAAFGGSLSSSLIVGLALAIGLVAAEASNGLEQRSRRGRTSDGGSGCGGGYDGGSGHDGSHGCGHGCGGGCGGGD